MKIKSVFIYLVIGFVSIANLVLAAPNPIKPTDLVALAFYDQINLLWTDNAPDEEGFIVERKSGIDPYSAIAILGRDTTFFLDTKLAPRRTYYYRVKAYHAVSESDYSNEAFATTDTPPNQADTPAAPSDLVARVIDGVYVELRWNDNSPNEQGFRIERRMPGHEFVSVGEVLTDIRLFKDDKVDPDSKYVYRVQAFNSKGLSEYSNEVLVETKKPAQNPGDPTYEPPAAPSNLTVEMKNRVLYFTWVDNSEDEEGFRIYLSINDFENYAMHRQLPKDSVQFEDGSLYIPDTTFYFKVVAFNQEGESVPSNEQMIRIRSQEEILPPTAPTELKAKETYESDVVLEWKDNADNETGYKLERRKVDESKFSVIQDLPANLTNFRDENLQPGTTYFYRVFAYNDSGSSASSNTLEVITKGTADPPPDEKKDIVIQLQIGSRTMVVNEKERLIDVTPTIFQGRTLLPIRPVVEALGGTIAFETNTKIITIHFQAITIIMQLNVPTAKVNGKSVPIDSSNPAIKPMVVPPGRTLIPLRFVAENLGCQVDWIASEKKIVITYKQK